MVLSLVGVEFIDSADSVPGSFPGSKDAAKVR
jgi:hypothetical protein